MSRPVFRNPDLYQELPMRNYLRLPRFPSGAQGLVVEDLDLVVRHFGRRFNQDDKGRFMLVEQKHPFHGILRPAQERTFGLLHELLRAGDPNRERYMGYYVLEVSFNEDGPVFPVFVNLIHALSQKEYDQWILGNLVLPSMFDEEL